MLKQEYFGDYNSQLTYVDRPAAYAVILSYTNKVAAIKGEAGYFLPGGGRHPGETNQQALIREVAEELARNVKILREIGRATQYFYASTDDRHYKLDATFFLAELGDKIDRKPEHDLCWISIADVSYLFYHQCHAWAVGVASPMKPEF